MGGKPQSNESNIKQQAKHVQVSLEDRDKPEAVVTDTISHGLDYVYFHSAYKNQQNPSSVAKTAADLLFLWRRIFWTKNQGKGQPWRRNVCRSRKDRARWPSRKAK